MWRIITYSKEQPLKILAVFLGIVHRVCRELEFLVELLSQIKEDCGSLEDVESVMRNGRDTTVRVNLLRSSNELHEAYNSKQTYFKEPFRLYLIMQLADICVSNAHRHGSARSKVFNLE